MSLNVHQGKVYAISSVVYDKDSCNEMESSIDTSQIFEQRTNDIGAKSSVFNPLVNKPHKVRSGEKYFCCFQH